MMEERNQESRFKTALQLQLHQLFCAFLHEMYLLTIRDALPLRTLVLRKEVE